MSFVCYSPQLVGRYHEDYQLKTHSMIPAMKFPPFPSQLGPLQKGAAVLVRKWKREVAMFLNQVPSTRCFLDEDAGQPQHPPAWTMEEAIKVEATDDAEEKESSSSSPKKGAEAEGIKISSLIGLRSRSSLSSRSR